MKPATRLTALRTIKFHWINKTIRIKSHELSLPLPNVVWLIVQIRKRKKIETKKQFNETTFTASQGAAAIYPFCVCWCKEISNETHWVCAVQSVLWQKLKWTLCVYKRMSLSIRMRTIKCKRKRSFNERTFRIDSNLAVCTSVWENLVVRLFSQQLTTLNIMMLSIFDKQWAFVW